MARDISHEDIAERFIQAKVVDFAAMGKLVAELGPTLALADRGWHGVAFGKFHTLACMMPASDLTRLVGSLGNAGLTAAALEGIANANIPR